MLSTNYLFTNHRYLIEMYTQDLALNNLKWLICHKTQPNQIIAQSAGSVEYTKCTSAEG